MNTEPLQVEWIQAQIGDEAGHRLMIVFAAPGCEWALESGGCTNCSFPTFFGTQSSVSTAELMTQLNRAINHIPAGDDGPVQVDLFVSGSLFNENEVPVDAQRQLLERTAQIPRVHRILVETRPEFVTPETMAMAMAAVGGKDGKGGSQNRVYHGGTSRAPILEVGIGLESADKEIRERRIRKGFSWRQFADSVRLVAQANAQLLVYLLLKPINTSEREAIEDLVSSAEKVFALSGEHSLPTRIALEPCFVAPKTEIERAYNEGRFRPPWLWSVIEVLQRAAHLGPFQVGLSDEGQDTAMAAHNCDECSSSVRAALARFNLDQDVGLLERIRCPCRNEWLQLVS